MTRRQALDEFKRFVQKNTLLEGLYVINSDNSDSPGRHWFMIFRNLDSLIQTLQMYRFLTPALWFEHITYHAIMDNGYRFLKKYI